ncbi:recombinase family protein [Roseibium album]|uniref:recombinase family protein n=1 Tax=Roseibium album TaxID=311410 RepID=UPI00391D0349
MNNLKKAIAYLRVSTKGQAEYGAGMQLQWVSIQAYAEAAGYEIVETFEDVHTAVGAKSAKDRQGLKEAVTYARQHGVPIIVDNLSRISRNTKTVDHLAAKKSVEIIRARRPGSQEHSVLLAEARRHEAEAERISETTRDGLRRAKERGVKLGNPVNLHEAQKNGAASNKRKAEDRDWELQQLMKLHDIDINWRRPKIAKALNAAGSRTANGKPWSAVSVRRPLDRIRERIEEIERKCKENPNWGLF